MFLADSLVAVAALVFPANVQDVGSLSEDDAPAQYRFTCVNTSDRPVVITRVETNCGCTSASFTTSAIASGKEGEVVLSFNPKHKQGRVDNIALVYTRDDNYHPVATLSLVGRVKPSADKWAYFRHRMGPLCLQRKRVTFATVANRPQLTERLACANSGSEPLRLECLKEMLPAYVSFRTEPEVIPPGAEADIVITVNVDQIPQKPQPGKTISCHVVLKNINTAPSERTITLNIK